MPVKGYRSYVKESLILNLMRSFHRSIIFKQIDNKNNKRPKVYIHLGYRYSNSTHFMLQYMPFAKSSLKAIFKQLKHLYIQLYANIKILGTHKHCILQEVGENELPGLTNFGPKCSTEPQDKKNGIGKGVGDTMEPKDMSTIKIVVLHCHCLKGWHTRKKPLLQDPHQKARLNHQPFVAVFSDQMKQKCNCSAIMYSMYGGKRVRLLIQRTPSQL